MPESATNARYFVPSVLYAVWVTTVAFVMGVYPRTTLLIPIAIGSLLFGLWVWIRFREMIRSAQLREVTSLLLNTDGGTAGGTMDTTTNSSPTNARVNGRYPRVVVTESFVGHTFGGSFAARNDDGTEDDVPQCVICLDAPREVALMPCKHFCACTVCADKLDQCPLCRSAIRSLAVTSLDEEAGRT